jgi:arsenate reductase
MAEAFLNRLGGGRFEARSSGLEPGTLNPVVVEAMQEAGIDISANRTKSVAGLLDRGENFQYVITVCDKASGERCPLFPGSARKLHWEFPDPSAFEGPHEEKLRRTREIRDMIRGRIEEFIITLR